MNEGHDVALPVDAVREAFLREGGPVVLTSPTGSGKSTRVPRWCEGRVVVVEPRRVACRSLAARVAEEAGTGLGEEVGYQVRDEARVCQGTRILFATPGIVLRRLADMLAADTIILDEFHERRLDVDLILALLRGRYEGRLVVMSATLDGDGLAKALSGTHLSAEGRMHPVDVRYRSGHALLPTAQGLEERLLDALDAASGDPGDVLVFLPGKAEIAAAAQALAARRDLVVLPLHGGLSLEEQSRAFAPARKRKVILATNVAETSITVPGVGVVIDGGLVRRTRYHHGRGFLSLVPVAADSADQRAGRAGRTGPGVCYRLWDRAAKLESTTPPEIHRESLVPLVLAAAAAGARVEALPFVDPPKEHALEAASEELRALGALDADGSITEGGRELFGLPLDAHLGRFLVEARRRGTLDDAIDLVGALSVGRPLFRAKERPVHEEDDLRASGCDAAALVRAVREGDPQVHGLSPFGLREARMAAARLRRALGVPEEGQVRRELDRDGLARTALAADPRCIHVARRRKRHLAFSNGGTEIELASESAAAGREKLEAVAVLDSRAVTDSRGQTRVLGTCALPVPLAWLAEAGLGRDRLAGIEREGDRVVARIERVYARRVIDEREEEPVGELAREAVRDLFLRGSLFPRALATTKERLSAMALLARLATSTFDVSADLRAYATPPPELEAWVMARLTELGVERGSDLALLSPEDLTAPDVPYEVRGVLDREFPRRVELGDSVYDVEYDLPKRQVVLRMVRGTRQRPPPRSYLPRFQGMRVTIEAGGAMHTLT